ncbi:MAG: hypothetical protein ACEQSK_09195 [Sphingomonadaceae bacterium]
MEYMLAIAHPDDTGDGGVIVSDVVNVTLLDVLAQRLRGVSCQKARGKVGGRFVQDKFAGERLYQRGDSGYVFIADRADMHCAPVWS